MQRLGWVILLCVSVDFSNPMLPGSIRFDPSESIEAVPSGTAAPINIPSARLARQLDRRELPPRLWIVQSGSTPLANFWRRRFLAVRPVRHQPDDLTAAFPAEDH